MLPALAKPACWRHKLRIPRRKHGLRSPKENPWLARLALSLSPICPLETVASRGHDGFMMRRFLFALFLALVGACPLAAQPGLRGGIDSLWHAPAPGTRSARVSRVVSIAPGTSVTLAEIAGTGVIRHLWLTAQCDVPQVYGLLVLRAWWDGEQEPSIEAPLGDFFGWDLAANASCGRSYAKCIRRRATATPRSTPGGRCRSGARPESRWKIAARGWWDYSSPTWTTSRPPSFPATRAPSTRSGGARTP